MRILFLCQILWPPEEAFKNWFPHTLNYVCKVSVSGMKDSANPGVYVPHQCMTHLWVYFLELFGLVDVIVIYLYMYTTLCGQLITYMVMYTPNIETAST